MATPGADYQLQRLAGDCLPVSGPATWLPLANVHATQNSAFAEDAVDPDARQRFYRVIPLEPLRILGVVLTSNNTWRVSWTAIPVADYQLQRLTGDNLPNGPTTWIPVANVRATDVVASAEDPLPSGTGMRFYRVVFLQPLKITCLAPVGANTWRVSWTATPGADYQLQRLAGDGFPTSGPAAWIPVADVRATNTTAFADDLVPPGTPRRFYRVIQLAPGFRIIDITRLAAPNTFRIRWESVAGNTYQLLRPANDTLPTILPIEWVPVATVYATGAVTVVTDTVPAQSPQRFYRVAQVTNVTGDVTPPTMTFASATFATTAGGGPALTLTYAASDNVGVTSVTVSEGATVLGQATNSAGRWVFTVPVDLATVHTRFFSATARDAAGNEGRCGPNGLVIASPELFAPVGTNGLPVDFQPLPATATNRVSDFIFRPGGRPRSGAAVDFFLRFPDGATLSQSNSQTLLEFSRVSAGFESNSPFALAAPLERAGGSPMRLIAGPLAYTNLAALFGAAVSNGVPLTVFNRFPTRWRGGVLDDRGLIGGQFRFEMPKLPLPEWSGSCAEATVELSRDRTLRVPFSGEFDLPDGTANPPRLRVGCGSPLWLSLRADGHAGLEGPVEIRWSSGASVEARLRFDDPKYHVALSGSGLRVQAVSNLVDLLPANPAACVPGNADSNQLSQATHCLDKFARAYGHFFAAVAASASNAPSSSAPPPDYLNLVGDALEAWSYSATAGLAQSLPLDAIAALVVQFGNQAGGVRKLPEVLAYRNALLRARAAVAAGGLSGSPSAQADLEAALNEAEAAALDRASDREATYSLADMRQAARMLLEAEALKQQIGLPGNPNFTDALEVLFRRSAAHWADSLGVQSGVFLPDANPRINGMNRFAAVELLRDLLILQADAQMLGIDLSGARLEELSAQLGVRLLRTVNAALDSTEAARDFPGFLLTFKDYLELRAWAQQGALPEVPALAPLRDGATFEAAVNRLLTIWASELERPYLERTVGRQAADVRAALRVLREVPGTVTWPVPAIRRAYDQLESTLTNATYPLRLSLQTNLVELLELLEAGTLHRELGARFGFPQPVSWENVRLPAVANRLNTVALGARAWRELDQAVRLLLNAADRAALDGDQTLRRAYLQQAAGLLATSREVARAMMQDARGLLRMADFALPGDIFLDDPAGYAFYDRQSGYFHGAGRGRLRLPKWSLALTVQNASFDNGGNFDLSAYGSLRFTNGQFTVPSRQPLHIYYGPERGLGLLGAAQLALDNGLRFDAFVALTDPIYRFSLAAQGIRFNLGRQMVWQRPVLDAAAVQQLGDTARDALADYLRSLNGSLEALLASVTNFPPVDPTGFGRPPEFVPPEITLDFATLNAWSAETLLRVRAGLGQAQQATLGQVLEATRRLNQETEAARAALADERARLARLGERLAVRRQMKAALNAAALSGELVDELLRALENGLRCEASNVVALATPELGDRLPDALDVVTLLYESAAGFQMFGLDDPDTPLPGDPCAAYTNAAASLRQRAEALALCAGRRHVAQLGLNPLTGAVTDTNRFLALSDYELERSLREVLTLEAMLQMQGDTTNGLLVALEPLLRRHRELTEQELARATNATRQFELTMQLMDNLAWGGSLGALDSLPEFERGRSNIIVAVDKMYAGVLATGQGGAEILAAQTVAHERRRQRQQSVETEVRRTLGRERRVQLGDGGTYTPGFFTQLADFIRLLRERGGVFSAAAATNANELVRLLAADLRARPFTTEFLTNRMNEAEALLTVVIGLTDWADDFMTNDFSALDNLRFGLSNLTFSVTAVAEAQRAWWWLARYDEALRRHTEIYGTNLLATLRDTDRQARSATLLASLRIRDALAELFDQVRYEDVVFQLPGRVEIPNLFGRLYYNRLSGYLQGCFGGRIEFPEVSSNLFFEISEACLANDGTYAITASTETPLPFGGTRLAANLNVQGNASGVASFAGAGTLTVTNRTTTNQFDVALSYEQQARRFTCMAQATNLDLRLGDDFVLFNAGFGFDITAAQPEGAFSVNGSAGLFARQRPLPATLSATNFHLVVYNLSTFFRYGTNGCDLVLSNGTIHLPEFFSPGLCPGAGPGGPAVGLSPSRPLLVRYLENPGPGQPPLTFDGQISFTNVGFNVPGIGGLGAEVCRATLLLVSNAPPLLRDLQGELRIPLPPGEANRLAIFPHGNCGGTWKLDGFPQGTICFTNGMPLIETNGFRFELMAWTPDCPRGEFSATNVPGVGPRFTLAGGIGVELPLSAVTGENGDRVRGWGCGAVSGSADGVRVEVERIGVGGRFRIGGTNGVLVEGDLVATNLGSLFDPAAQQLVGLTVTGRLTLPNGITGTLTNGLFTFERRAGQVVPARLRGDAFIVMPDNGPQFAATVDYNADTRTFSFDSRVSNLTLKLTDDLVIFEAGLGFSVMNGAAAGQLRASGTAGLFAKQTPLPTPPQTTNFHLFIDHVTTALTLWSNQIDLTLSNGTLHLPEFFRPGTNTSCAPSTGPAVGVSSGNPIVVTVRTTNNQPTSVSFNGGIGFTNLGFAVPGLTNLAVEVCSAHLLFRSGQWPCLSNFHATLTLALAEDKRAAIGLSNLVWRLDGFPDAATIVLLEPLALPNLGGFAFEFLAGSSFGFTNWTAGGQPRAKFTLAGGLKGTFSADLLSDTNGGAFSFTTAGALTWVTGELPAVALDSVTFAGRMKLGGAVELLGVDANGIPDAGGMASITLTGFTNPFHLSPSRPFEVTVSGALGSADFLYFGLRNARLRFDGAPPEPQFTVDSLGFREGTALKLLGQDRLPFRITAGSIAFLDPSKPLSELFAPTNLRFTFSGVVDISLTEPDPSNPSGLPRLYGAVTNVVVTLPNGFSGPPQFQVAAFMLALENLTIGDMAGLTGGLGVGGLDSPNPDDLFFAGMVGGGYNGVGIKAIVALKLTGLLGLCLDVKAGPAGIPLDGGSLGGILLSGAQGGVSFANQFADPCDFKSYLGLSDSGQPAARPAGDTAVGGGAGFQPAVSQGSNLQSPESTAPPGQLKMGDTADDKSALPQKPPALRASQLPVLTWAELAQHQRLHDDIKALRAAGWNPSIPPAAKPLNQEADNGPAASDGQSDTNCPTGDCPPRTMNLLCQWHPSRGQEPLEKNYYGKYSSNVIFKLSSLDKKTVDQLLAMAGINVNGSATEVGRRFAEATTNFISNLIPRPPPHLPGASNVIAAINGGLIAVNGLVSNAVAVALNPANLGGRTPLEALYETAYAGVKCVDITIQLKGTFTYAPVSVALSATGGGVASTTGSAGLLGSVNLFGLPVGTAELFYSVTDQNGDPNPSLCGGAQAGVGPLELGKLGLAIRCDGCATGILQALANFIQGLTGDVLNQVSPIIRVFIRNAAGHRLDANTIQNRPLVDFFGTGAGRLLTPEEQVAVLSALLNLPTLVQYIQTHPGAVPEFDPAALTVLGERVFQLVLAMYHATNPSLRFCGQVEPKLFGFSLSGGATLVGAHLSAEKSGVSGDVTFSPSFLMANLPFWLMSGGLPLITVAPPLDEATMGFAVGAPVINEPMLRLMTTNPVAFANVQLDHLLDRATFTFGYELIPFGLKLADAEGRVMLPTLANHPNNPTGYWGGSFVVPTNPDRVTLLKAALDANVLALATWDGKSNNLVAILPSYPALAYRELGRDYFPYGGFLGAGKLLFPKPIHDAPPMTDLMALFAPITDVGQLPDRLNLANRLFNDYLLGTTNVGQLVTYIPAPRPPPAFWLLAQKTPQAFMDSITRMDLATLAQNLSFWPAEQFLMQGNARGQVLGMPLGQAEIVADLGQGLLRLSSGTAQGWLTNFISAGITGEVRTADYILHSTNLPPGTTAQDLKPEVILSNAWYAVSQAMQPGATEAQKRAALSNAIARITDVLPKASLTVGGSLRIPPELTNVLTASGSASFYAFSPRFDPGHGGSGPVADARRNGGIALQGQLNFANYVNIADAQLGVAVRPVGLPVLSGEFDVPQLGVPGLALRNAHFGFNSDPPVGSAYIAASGEVLPIAFTNPINSQVLLTIRNLTNASAPIAATFNLLRAASGPPLPGFAISPSRIDMPMLGPGVMARIHGATTNDPFAFSSTGSWTGKVSITGQLSLRDIFGQEVARVGAPAGQQFSAELSGTGMQMDRLAIATPTNIDLIAFPGTDYAYTNRVGTAVTLVISRDGNFFVQSQLGANLDLRGLGFGSISADASFQLTPTNFVLAINNNLYGGALTNFSSATMSGSLTITRNGVSLTGSATVSAFSMGVFWVSGMGGPPQPLQALLDNNGLRLLSGARLRIITGTGYEQGVDVLTLGEFFISGNGDFSVTVTNGNLNLPSFFSVTQGVFSLSRTGGNARLYIQSPTLTLLPGQYFQTEISGVFDVLDISSNGRVYAKKSVNNLALPAAFRASGQLEVGYEPDSRQPGLGVNTNAIAFGNVNYGSSSNRVLNVTNTGVGTLFVSFSSSRPEVFTAMPFMLNLEPGQVGAVSVRFTPTGAGYTNATLTLTHNATGSARTIALSGTGLTVPMLRLSTTNLPFGDAQLGASLTRLLRVDNPGAVSLVVTCALYQTGPYTYSTNRLTIPPGSNALLMVTFAPTNAATFSNRLDFTANDQPGVRSVALSGRGYENRWYLQSEGAGTLRAAAFHNSGLGLALGDAGLIRITRNHGHSWYDKPAWPPLEIGNLYAAAFSSSGDYAVVAGDGGAIVDVTVAFGKTFNWQQYYKGVYPGYTFSGASFLPGTNRYVLVGYNSSGGNLVFVKGNSFVWSEVAIGRKLNAVSMAAVGASTIGLIGTDGGRVLRSTDLGSSWSTAFSSTAIGNITGVALATTGWALFVTDTGRIYQSSTSGTSWSQVTTGRGQLRAVTLAGNTVAYAVNAEGQILASTNSGSGFNTWSMEESGLGALYGAGATTNRAWCVSDNARLYHRPPYTLNRGILNYSPNNLDFGLVVAGASKSQVLTLYNRGLQSLQINNLRPLQYSNYLSFSPVAPFTIAARQSTAVNVFFNPPGDELIYSLGDLLIESADLDGTQTNEMRGWTRTNGWVLKPSLPNAAGETVRDVQMVSDAVGYAITSTNIYRTSNGGATWTLTGKPPVDRYFYALHFTSTTSGFVCGGTLTRLGDPRPVVSFIYQTTDSGSTWTARYSVTNRWPVRNIYFADTTTGYALTGYEPRTMPPQYPGIILRSVDGGSTWSEITNPVGTAFNGRALHSKSATQLFVSHNDILYQSLNSGGSWGDLFSNGGNTINHIFFYGTNYAHVIGENGSVWQTTTGGGVPSSWSQQASFGTNNLNGGWLVGAWDGWITPASTAPAAAIYQKVKGSWIEQLTNSPLPGPPNLKPTVVSGRSLTNAVALGTDGCVRRIESFTNELVGVVVVPPLVDLGAGPVGTPLSKTFTLRNVGDRSLVVSNILVDGVAGFNNGFRVTTATPFTVAIGGSYTVTVVASNLVAGTHNAELQILSDGAARTVAMGVRSATLAPPQVVVFQTDPPGLPLRINGVLQAAPVAYTVCVGATAPYEWELGSTNVIEAIATTNLNGQEMLFAGWLPFADRVWTNVAEPSSQTYTATYVVGAPSSGGTPPPGGTSTNGLPFGPYLRLSNASLSNAVLGNFSISGSVLLCATNIEAALATTSVRMPTNPAVAPVAELTAGAWRFQFTGGQVLLNAQSPSLKLLGNAVTPPSTLNLFFNDNGNFRGDFSLPQGWKVAPGLLEFGPSSIVLAHTNFFYLASSGEVRALCKPDSPDWAFKTSLSLTFRDGPFTNSLTLPGSILRLTVPVVGTEFVEVRGGSNSRFEVWRNNANVFTARLTNVVLEVMDQAVSTNSLLVSSAGLLTWSSQPPAAPFALGPFQWDSSGASYFYWNIKNGALSFNLAGGTLKASGVPGWPAEGHVFPSMSFDSKGDFAQTISMPTFKFDDIPLGSSGSATFKRQNGVLSMSLRGTQSFFGSTMQEGFDINSAGAVSGFFYGSFGVDFGLPLGRFEFANTYLTYNSGLRPYQFQGQLRVAMNDFRVRFGADSDGVYGEVCHLLCGSGGCSPTLCLTSP